MHGPHHLARKTEDLSSFVVLSFCRFVVSPYQTESLASFSCFISPQYLINLHVNCYRIFLHTFTSPIPYFSTGKPPMEVSHLQPAFPADPHAGLASSVTMDDVDDMDIDLGPIDDGEAIQLVSSLGSTMVVAILILLRRTSISLISQIHRIRTTPATDFSHLALTLITLLLIKFTFAASMTSAQRILWLSLQNTFPSKPRLVLSGSTTLPRTLCSILRLQRQRLLINSPIPYLASSRLPQHFSFGLPRLSRNIQRPHYKSGSDFSAIENVRGRMKLAGST